MNTTRSIFSALAPTLLIVFFTSLPALAEDFALHTFDIQQLTDVYYSEGINTGDLNNDDVPDIIYGPYWFPGPAYKTKHEIYPAKPQPRERYADHFFAWTYDFDNDGWNDVLTVGFPGTPAYVYQNPGTAAHDRHWPKHQILDWVSNESPHFTNIVGDGRPELVCTRDGYFGFATINRSAPFEPWTFHAISDQTAPPRFGHGLGVGDVNGDTRPDVLTKDGWFEQPPDPAQAERWPFHPVPFANPGGAEIYAYDVDGDGDNDVITSLGAHDFGLAWHEQITKTGNIAFRQHLIMGHLPEQNKYGLVFTEPHSVNLADVDGDGLADIITGKTYWSHHQQSPMWDAGAVVYWFRLARTQTGIDWIPQLATPDTGIGRQLIIADINRDQLPDILVGGMKGAHLLTHRQKTVTKDQWLKSQPKPYTGPPTALKRGPKSKIDPNTSRVPDAFEAEQLRILSTTAGKTLIQDMKNFRKDRWSGNAQLLWSGAKPTDRLTLEIPVPQAGTFNLEMAFTMARDFATIRILLDDQPLAEKIVLYNYPDVITTGILTFGPRQLSAGPHKLTLQITGAHPSATKAHLVGLDHLRLVPTSP
jgi:hypothetical protein